MAGNHLEDFPRRAEKCRPVPRVRWRVCAPDRPGLGRGGRPGEAPPRGDAIDLSAGGAEEEKACPPEGTPGPLASAQAPQREGLGPAAQSCPGLLGLAFQKQSCPAASDTS